MTEVILIRGTRYEVHNCITCGVAFTVPEVVIDKHRRSGGYHSCSNGHRQGWNETESEDARIRRERDRLLQQTARLEDEKREAQEATRKVEAALQRHKKRSASGTCPCCKRTFANMTRHMKTKHPDFGQENVVKLKA